jgi:murein L,D-transpeptidase YcbB/YkuD
LRDALQRIFGTTMPGDDPLHYDEQLAERVREFQRGHRLTIDGVVGAQTQMAMQTALGEPGIPLLTEAD